MKNQIDSERYNRSHSVSGIDTITMQWQEDESSPWSEYEFYIGMEQDI